jgi:cobalt/nickel transport system ATP-binding protein
LSPAPAASLDVRDLRVIYDGSLEAVRGISLSLRAGERAALLGPNGAGKSSILLAAAGLLPFAGEVRIDGSSLSRATARELRARIGIVFQNPDDQLFLPALGEDVAFGLRERGVAESDVARRVGQALAAVGLRGAEARAPHRLSGGEKRAAALATVLALDPGLMLLDEPTSGLDARSAREVVARLRGIPATVLVATHDLALARELAARAILVEEGRAVADEPIESVLADRARLERLGLA